MNGIVPDFIPLGFFEIPDLTADRETAFQNSIKAHSENKARFDRKRHPSTSFETGDRVFVENGKKLNRHKIDEIRIGPYPIVRKLSDTVYELNVGKESNAKLKLYHVSKMLKFND
jgi:hypothetical protein